MISKFLSLWRRKQQVLTSSVNMKWKHLLLNKKILLPKKELIRTDSKIFCIGSCFALEVRRALKELEYTVHPNEDDFKVQLPEGKIYSSDGRQLVHYNTFTIRQEFEKAFGLWSQDTEDIWHIKKERKGRMTDFFQDPYRRKVISRTKEGAQRITRAFDDVMKRGIFESDVYIITLGLTEIWKKRNNDLTACMVTPDAGDEIFFVRSGFDENYENIRKTIELIHSRFPGRPVILTVSPVTLACTFTHEDVYIANTESKSILRAVAGRAAHECADVHYFPAFEICSFAEKMRRRVYRADGRHVHPAMVKEIMKFFMSYSFFSSNPGFRKP